MAFAGGRRDRIPHDLEEQLPLSAIAEVTFYKRDEVTTDLICCEVQANGETWFFHEEAEGWDAVIDHLKQLPGFKSDWYEAVVRPPFASSKVVAYMR